MLFNKTLHSGHWSKVKFGTMQDFNRWQNKTLTLVVLTWLRQMQQYFLQRPNDNNGDWSKLGKYCGTTTNHFKSTTPLANINFSQYLQQQVPELITHVKDFKPLENRDKKEYVRDSKNGHYVFLHQAKSFHRKISITRTRRPAGILIKQFRY